jgi:hypothetical protein
LSAAEVMAKARSAGVELFVRDGRLASRGPALPELRADIYEHKPALIALLTQSSVSLDPDGQPCAPCSACNGLSFWRRDSTSTWVCIRCAGQPVTGELGEWCAVPPVPGVPKNACHGILTTLTGVPWTDDPAELGNWSQTTSR